MDWWCPLRILLWALFTTDGTYPGRNIVQILHVLPHPVIGGSEPPLREIASLS